MTDSAEKVAAETAAAPVLHFLPVVFSPLPLGGDDIVLTIDVDAPDVQPSLLADHLSGLPERLQEVNASRPTDKPMKFIEFMHEVANGQIKMEMYGTP